MNQKTSGAQLIDWSTKFRNTQGVRLLKPLFRDFNADNPLYTLRNQDHPEGYPSLKKLYMEMEDITEYLFSEAYFEDYDHWLALCECNWFKPYVSKWRKELELKLRAKEINRIRNIAEDGETSQALRASTYLLDKGYGKPSEKGRPSKEDVAKAADDIAQEKLWLKEDSKRLADLGIKGSA